MRILALLQSLNVTQNPFSSLVIILPLKRMKFPNVSSHQWRYCKDEFDPFYSLLTAMKKAGALRRNSCKRHMKANKVFELFWGFFCTDRGSGADAVHRLGWERAAIHVRPIALSAKGMLPGNSI